MSTRVVLVRHAESEWNAQGRLQGQGGAGLSELGRRQAAVLADYLWERFPDARAAVCSDLQRARETAQPWLSRGDVEIVAETAWREIDVGSWSGLTWEEVQAADPQRYAAWRAGEDVRRGGGETFAEFRARTDRALDGLRRLGHTVVVFTHGGSVRFAVAEALGLPVLGERVLAPVHNCSVTEVALGDDGAKLLSYNLHDHLASVVV